MKKTALLLTCTVLFSYTITNNKIYKEKIETDNFKTNLRIIINKKNLPQLINILNDNVSKLKTYCQTINYSFTPVYKYLNKTEVFDTYKAYINAVCVFKKEKIKSFSKMLNSLKESKVRLNSFTITINETAKQKIINNLRIKAYNDIIKETEAISSKLNKKCFATNIRMYAPGEPPKHPAPIYRMKTLSAETAPLPTPKSNENVSLKVDYQIECY